MSKQERMNYLDKVPGKENQKDVCKYMKDKATLQFLCDALKPILEVQDSNSSLLLRIGSSEPAVYRKFVPYLASPHVNRNRHRYESIRSLVCH